MSDAEAALYEAVTTHVQDEMNRAERFAAEGDDKRRQNVGFALQILQRRLASSPAAIHESLRRRRERLEARLAEERLSKRGREPRLGAESSLPSWSAADEAELEDAPGDEAEATEEAILDRATAARTIAELETEIAKLGELEATARTLRRAGNDAKWSELNANLDHPLMTDAVGNRRKLIVFTEPRDTLNYLAERIRSRLGRAEAVGVIHGGVRREERRKAVEAFTHDKDVLVLVANDAAGEGINPRDRDRLIGRGAPVQERYERICFDKDYIDQAPVAAYVCPGHPLLDATMDLVLERHRNVLKQGAVLVDESGDDDAPRVLFYFEHAIQDAQPDGRGGQREISRRLQFVEIDASGSVRDAGPAPYLDLTTRRMRPSRRRRRGPKSSGSPWTRSPRPSARSETSRGTSAPRIAATTWSPATRTLAASASSR